MNFGLENHYSAETTRNHSGAKAKPFLLETTLKKERKKRKKFEVWVFEEGRGSMMYVVSWPGVVL